MEDDNFKQVRDSRCPIKCQPTVDHIQLKQVVYDKMRRYNSEVALYKMEDLKLCYKNGERIHNIPGTDTPFSLKAYKDDLGVCYHTIVVYLMPYESDFLIDDDDNDDL